MVCLTFSASAYGADPAKPAEKQTPPAQPLLTFNITPTHGNIEQGQLLDVLRDQVNIAGQQLAIVHLPQPQRELFVNDLRHLVLRCQAIEAQLEPKDIAHRPQAANLVSRIHYLLALEASKQHDLHESSFRMGQLRAHCWQLKQHPSIALQQQADHWLLLADLFDIQNSKLPVPAQQTMACTRIERFLHEQQLLATTRKDTPSPQPDWLKAKLMLIHLYDQLGQSSKVKQWIEQLIASQDNASDLVAGLHARYRYVNFLGQPIDLSVTTADGKSWQASASRGKKLLLVLGRASQLAEKQLADWLSQQGMARDTLEVVHAVVGKVDAQTDVSSWPARTYIQADQVGTKLTQLWSITRLPRWALLNEQNQLVMIGTPPSIHAALIQALTKESALH